MYKLGEAVFDIFLLSLLYNSLGLKGAINTRDRKRNGRRNGN